jgi:hypothetical protein
MEAQWYPTSNLDAWHQYYEELDCTGPYHHPEYVAALEGNHEYESEEARLFVLEDDGDVVYYPYLTRPLTGLPFPTETGVDTERYRDVVSSWYYGGPLTSSPDRPDLVESFLDVFHDHCVEQDYIAEFIRFDPNCENHETFSALDPTFNRETVPVDLTKGEQAVWDGFSSSNRNHIRNAQESPLDVGPARGRDDYEAFYDVYCDAMEAKGATEHYWFDYEFFRGLLEDVGIGELVVSWVDDEFVGGSFFVHDGSTACEFLRASDPDYWDMRVNNYLCYEAILRAMDLGCTRFDFQGGRPGVFEFKSAFSPLRGEFFTATRTHLPDVYDRLVEDARTAGVDTSNEYFPAYRIPQSN